MEEFDYFKTVDEVEQMLVRIEDPQTGVSQARELIARANACLDQCYEYLRTEREKL